MSDNMKTDVEILKKDVAVISKLVDKFDATIDKLQQVASDLSRVVVIQEQKMIQQDKINDETNRILERQDKEHGEELKELKKRFDDFEDNIIAQISGLEKWRYMIMAFVSVFVFIIGTFSNYIVKALFG